MLINQSRRKREINRKIKSIIQDILLTSGLHSHTIFQSALITKTPLTLNDRDDIAVSFEDDNIDVDVILACCSRNSYRYELQKSNCRSIFAKERRQLTLRRGFAISPKKILLVEDRYNNAGSILELKNR